MRSVTPPREPRARRRRLSSLARLTVFAVAALPTPLGAAPPAHPGAVAVARVSTPIALDGRLVESAWERCLPLSLAQLSPAAGAAPTERTEVLLAYDDENLYVGARLFDREPSKIQSTTKRRDAETASAEWFGIVIDTFNDKENAVAFFTTPAGLRWDAAVLGDGSLPLNVEWNTDWAVATARDERGWFAEFRIPLASLRFEEVDRQVVMGLISWRLIARKNEVDIYPPMPGTWGLDARFKPSQAREVVLDGLVGRRPLLATPYVLGGARHGGPGGGTPREAGLDVKYGLTSNLTLDVTVNPDFAQAEADDVQTNLTRFALFYPEKRAFFQERGANFDFGFGGSNTVFYSRRVGLSGDGPVRILAGARVVGRVGPWDVGALDLQEAGPAGEAGANVGVVRVRRRVLNDYSYAGGIVATRVSATGANVAYGLDSLLRLARNDYLQVGLAQTAGSDGTRPRAGAATARARVAWERRTRIGLAYELSVAYAGRDYEPELGFEERRNFTSGYAALAYGWLATPGSAIHMQRAGIDASVVRANSLGRIESVDAGAGWGLRTTSGYRLNVLPRWGLEEVAEAFTLGPRAHVPEGRYAFRHLITALQTPDTRVVSAGITVDAGELYDGRRVSLQLTPAWHVSPDVALGIAYSLDDVRFEGRGQRFRSQVTRVRASWAPTTQVSLSALVQHSSTTGGLAANLRLRYNPREGVDLWLVYDQTGSAGPRPPGAAPLARCSTFLAKYTYTFRVAMPSRGPRR